MWELPFQPLELFWNASLTSEKEKQKLIYYINEENKKKKEKKIPTSRHSNIFRSRTQVGQYVCINKLKI